MVTESIPTLKDIEAAIVSPNFISAGLYRSVYRIPGTKWVVKRDSTNGESNRAEYKAYLRYSPSMSRPNLRFPEMRMVGKYLIAEFIVGEQGSHMCWGGSVRKGNKHYYSRGCNRKDKCPNGKNCWARLTRQLSRRIPDIHYANVIVTREGVVYVIDIAGTCSFS